MTDLYPTSKTLSGHAVSLENADTSMFKLPTFSPNSSNHNQHPTFHQYTKQRTPIHHQSPQKHSSHSTTHNQHPHQPFAHVTSAIAAQQPAKF
jgi:hypothetical protein